MVLNPPPPFNRGDYPAFGFRPLLSTQPVPKLCVSTCHQLPLTKPFGVTTVPTGNTFLEAKRWFGPVRRFKVRAAE